MALVAICYMYSRLSRSLTARGLVPVVRLGVPLGQGWPHFLCSGQKNRLKKLGGHNNVSKKAWREKFYHVKTHNTASLNLLKNSNYFKAYLNHLSSFDFYFFQSMKSNIRGEQSHQICLGRHFFCPRAVVWPPLH